ncbi:MAG: M23 family metallopeptidase [Defluviitaleaceae bacterium]|nr:M23 family metallopeptidase [Defluviitaleaceae bacterium]
MKNTSQGESVFRKRGFFIALYSCLGAVAVLAFVVSFAARSGQGSSEQDLAHLYEENAVAAGADQVETYRAQVDDEAWFRPRQQPTPTQPLPPAEPPPPPREHTPPREVPPPPEPPEPPPEPTPEAVVQPETFTAFEEGDSMLWPVDGDIVMEFSMTSLIYDQTLDQFRTNDHLRISAEEGDPVRAAADGKVVAIGRESRRGHYITIDHGNGWLTTYGQLMANPLVAKGEIVRSGQVIGGIGRQTMFTSLDGSHLHLQVTHNDQPVNPHVLLER